MCDRPGKADQYCGLATQRLVCQLKYTHENMCLELWLLRHCRQRAVLDSSEIEIVPGSELKQAGSHTALLRSGSRTIFVKKATAEMVAKMAA